MVCAILIEVDNGYFESKEFVSKLYNNADFQNKMEDGGNVDTLWHIW